MERSTKERWNNWFITTLLISMMVTGTIGGIAILIACIYAIASGEVIGGGIGLFLWILSALLVGFLATT
jgi:hypothetical protein